MKSSLVENLSDLLCIVLMPNYMYMSSLVGMAMGRVWVGYTHAHNMGNHMGNPTLLFL